MKTRWDPSLGRWLAALVALSMGGCGEDVEIMDAAMDASQDASPDETLRSRYLAEVAPIFAASCDSCHATGANAAPIFSTDYETFLDAELLSCARPSESAILTRGAHTGPALDPTDERPTVEAWATAWAETSSTCTARVYAQTGPFTPILGSNDVDLSGLGSGLAGARLTFTAEKVGMSDMYLSAIQLHAGTGGLKVVAPVFQVCRDGAPADEPTDLFAEVDTIVPAETSADLGPGTLSLQNVPVGTSFAVRFQMLEPEMDASGEPIDLGGACPTL